MWISKEEYKEKGREIISSRCNCRVYLPNRGKVLRNEREQRAAGLAHTARAVRLPRHADELVGVQIDHVRVRRRALVHQQRAVPRLAPIAAPLHAHVDSLRGMGRVGEVDDVGAVVADDGRRADRIDQGGVVVDRAEILTAVHRDGDRACVSLFIKSV